MPNFLPGESSSSSQTMVSRRKFIKMLLEFLRDPAPLNYNKGPVVSTPHYISKKDKRHSGWITPRWNKHTGMKYKEAIQAALEPQDIRDEWADWRDGTRNYFSDASHFKKHISAQKFDNPFIKEWEKPEHVNKKLIKEMYIRRAAKLKRIHITN